MRTCFKHIFWWSLEPGEAILLSHNTQRLHLILPLTHTLRNEISKLCFVGQQSVWSEKPKTLTSMGIVWLWHQFGRKLERNVSIKSQNTKTTLVDVAKLLWWEFWLITELENLLNVIDYVKKGNRLEFILSRSFSTKLAVSSNDPHKKVIKQGNWILEAWTSMKISFSTFLFQINPRKNSHM